MFYTFYHHIKNRCFDELNPLPAPIREAWIFEKTCQEIPLSILPEDLIGGRYGCPEEPAETAPARAFASTDAYAPGQRDVWDEFFRNFAIQTRFDRGHTCIDYGAILHKGLAHWDERVCAALSQKSRDDAQRTMLEAMRISLRAVRQYAARFAALAGQQSETVPEPRRTQLLQLQCALNRVPWMPAQTILEGFAAVWILHSVIPISDNSWASISLGRLDQYLYPLYRKALAEGECRETIRAYLKNLFVFLNLYGDGACALNLGGLDAQGNDQMNDLSRLLIEVEKEIAQPSPILAARVHPGMPPDVLDALIDRSLFAIGQPTFYGELPCREALLSRGVTPEEAVAFSVNSCMGLCIPGKEIASMWGCVMNMHLPLELAVNGGKPICHALPVALTTQPPVCVESVEDILAAYEAYFRELLTILLDMNRKNAINRAANTPNPLLSAITEGCIERGADRAVAAVYNTETVEMFALVDTGNAIAAIEELVFRKQKYTLAQLVDAAARNYEGCGELAADLKKCPKYGTNHTRADEICRRLCEITAKLCRAFNRDNVLFLPSLHTLDNNVSFGQRLYATLDGRRAGQPVAKNAGPTNDVRTADPTSMILSAAALNQKLLSGGQPIDLSFPRSALETKEQRDRIRALIQTYFQLGGLQLQVNSADVAMLERAYADPQAYPGLLVRVGGFSRRFVDMSRQAQWELIERMRAETA